MFIMWTCGKKNGEEILRRQCPRINYVLCTTHVRTLMMMQRAQQVVPVLQDA